MRQTLIVGAIVLAGAAALAHEGVKDPGVKARMDNMGDVRAAMAVLGDMAKGKTAFDAALAAQARSNLIAAADAVPALFEVPHDDPMTEALPAIWTSWPDFQANATAFSAAANALDPGSLAGLRAGLGAIGGTCKSCHETYRQKK